MSNTLRLERFPLGRPQLEILEGDPEYPFRLTKDFVYLWPGDKDFGKLDVCVPAGYCTDLLSIPKVLWPILSPFGAGCWGSLPHDILYSTEFGLPGESISKRLTRDNRILKQACIDSGAHSFRAGTIFLGVQLGGRFTWWSHKKEEVTEDLILMSEALDRWQSADRKVSNT